MGYIACRLPFQRIGKALAAPRSSRLRAIGPAAATALRAARLE